MAGSVNKVILIGNLGADPEIRTFPSGGKICTLSIATSERWKDRETGEQRERTEWHRVELTTDGLAKVAEQYLRKGSKVYIEGKLETQKWQDQSGQDRYTTKVMVRGYGGQMHMLDRRDGGQGGGYGGGGGNYDERTGPPAGPPDSSGPGDDYGSGAAAGLDDEIPF